MEEVKRNSLQAWILAARPKTLAGAITPVMIGCALAFADGKFNWIPALICCLFAGLMQVAANFINDLFDFLKGTDREDRLGPERACAQGWISAAAMKQGIFITVGLACLIGCTLLFYAGWDCILRLRSGRGYLLRTGSQLDTKRHGCITGMRTDCRYITGS